MKKILFLVRSTKPFGSQRRDLDLIMYKLVKEGYKVDLYDPKQKLLMNLNDQTIEDYNFFSKFLFISKVYLLLNFIVLCRFLRKNKGNYDLIHINYVRYEYLLVPNLIANLGKKLIITLFGCDVNERNFVKNKLTEIYSLAHTITVSTTDFKKVAEKYIEEKKIKDKIKVILFPQDHFGLYEEYDINNKLACKTKLKIDSLKTVIVVGTNSNENEQHELIIHELKKLENKENYYLIFPLSNREGFVTDREKMLSGLISKELNSFDCMIINEFISYEKMRDIRFASDIFINLRRNDQLTISMLESNLAYCNVITGKWLPYNDYWREVNITIIDNFDELTNSINMLINEKPLEKFKKLAENKKTVNSKFGDGLLNKWISLYKNQ